MPDEQFKVTWIDAHREPVCDPNPDFPNGTDLIAGDIDLRHCTVALKHPAKRCGYWRIECRVCGQRVMATTAGRADDPASITFNCHIPPPKPGETLKGKPTRAKPH